MNKFLNYIFLILAIAVFLILAWKKPYGTSSLIGNFDPFPDSLHYVIPARNFILGNDFTFAREGGKTAIGVPPLYSMALIPIYFINHDARSFYFANLLLGILSIILLFKISQKKSKSVWVTGLLLFTYATSFVIYWQPSLAMAENVLLPACFFALWFALQPLTTKNILFGTITAVACYGSKYVSLPITGVFILFLLGRILTEQKKSKAIKSSLLIIILALFTFLFFNGSQFFNYLSKIFQGNLNNNLQAQSETSWLSLQYFSQSFPKYFMALLGAPIYNLWYVKAILPMGLALIVLVWCLFAILKLPKQRRLGILILALTFAQLAFLSVIQMVEGRYAFIFIPIMMTGAAAMMGWLIVKSERKFGKKTTNLLQIGIVGILAGLLLLANFKDLKTQLLLNFKGGEMPWWQVGIQSADQFMQKEISTKKEEKPIMISSLSPFVWDFYRQGNYQILPFNNSQSMMKEKIWGEGFDTNNLFAYYRQELENNRTIYLDTVGFGRTDWLILEEYKVSGFELELLQEDCAGACKIYGVKSNENYNL